MQVGDRVRVKNSPWSERNGQTAEVLRVKRELEESVFVKFDSDGVEWWFWVGYLEPLPKDLAVGKRVRVRQGYVRAGEEAFVVASDSESESAFRLRFDNGDKDWYGDIALEVLPPEDSEKQVIHGVELAVDSDLQTLPFSELSLLDVLIAALDNESLGRVVRALREAGYL